MDGRPNRKNKPAFPNFSGEGRMGHLQQNYFLINNAAKCKIQKPSTCRATLFRCNFWVDRFRFFNLSRKVAQQKKLLQVGEMQRADWLICLVWIQDKLRAGLMKNEQQSQNLLLKVNPRSSFRNNFLQTATRIFVARQVHHAR